MVQLFLLKGANKDGSVNNGWSPLHLAAFHGHVLVVLALLAAGVDTSLRCGDEEAPVLHLAAGQGCLEVLKALIEHGVEVDATDGNDWTALHHAAKYGQAEAIGMLLEAGGNIKAKGVAGGNPLHVAAACLSVESALVLLRHGAQVNSRASSPSTPLHCAAFLAGKQGAAEMVDFLLRSGADETIKNEDGFSAADRIGYGVEEQDRVAEDFERVCKLLASASVDRAWRRRSLFVLSRAHPNRVQLTKQNPRARVGMSSGGHVIWNSQRC